MSESHDDGQCLVRVRALVMTRDDSSGGWVPVGRGGLSNVSVCKKTPEKNEYLIHGKRISDQSVVLSCTIKKDFEYNKVMPTFHHWKSGEKKYGLTFQTAADARAFDKGVCIAIEDLLDGLSPSLKRKKEVGEDEVFMALDLPVERDSMSSGSSGPYPPPLAPHLHRMYFSGNGGKGDREGPLSPKEMMMMKEGVDEEPYSSYVQFASEMPRPHEYSYPMVQPRKDLSSSSSYSPPKKPVQLDPLSLQPPPLLPTKSTSKGSAKKKRTCGRKTQCRDCGMVYSEDCNPRGCCSAGPDAIRDGIERVSCMGCARGMLYHCLSGEEGEVPPHPCAVRHHRCVPRWIALSLLSLVLPCLCLYLPLAGCHRVGKKCHICGARHHPS